MTSPVLFSTGATPASGPSRNLVEFKAGKMEMRDKLVHPLKKKGLVYLRQSPEDNLMHFCWKDRQTGVVEDDLILIPDDCEFKRVNECKTGRVYVLKLKSANKRLFFWMQEPQTESDEDYCKKINDMLNNPPRAGSDAGSSSGERDLHALLSNMSQDQLSQLLSQNGVNLASIFSGRSPSHNSGGSATSTASTTNSSAAPAPANQSNPAIPPAATNRDVRNSPNINDYRALLTDALDGNEEEAEALVAATLGHAVQGSSGQRSDGQPSVMVDLSHVINSESLANLLEDENFVRQIQNHLPPVSASSIDQPAGHEGVRKQALETIRSSQFRSNLSQFCSALQSGQLGPLMSQFGLNQACVEAANLGNLETFVRALESQMNPNSTSSASADKSDSSNQSKPASDQQDKK